MSERAWTADLRGTLEAVTERAAVSGASLTEAGMDLVLVHIEAAYQRGLMAGRSQSGYAARRTTTEEG
ncbi:hypothetical protein [Streptomyces sp. NPDC101776]|uniref:hypothetical protein n=1 Tax=Streptomyces sp. NPDC101776 TaxID=3366146 RepID=UPI0038265918